MTSKEGMRRRAPRMPIDVAGSLSGRTTRPVRVMDLSLTGCLVRCSSLLDRGAILDLRIDLGDEPLVLKARVAEVSLDGESLPQQPAGCLAGLEFLGLPFPEETRLLRFLEDERRKRCASDP